MAYLNLRPEQTSIFIKLMEERYRQHATIITTHLDYTEWHHFLGNNALVDALLSRLRHQCPPCASTARRCSTHRADPGMGSRRRGRRRLPTPDDLGCAPALAVLGALEAARVDHPRF